MAPARTPAREVPEAPGTPPLSDHHSPLSQADKGTPPSSQEVMETLRDIRAAFQAAGGGSRLHRSNSSRQHADPTLWPGSVRSPRQPVPPPHRRRGTGSVSAALPPSLSLLSEAEPSPWAPSIMEPLLCPSTLMQASAHIQTRLGSRHTVNEQRGLLPRTAKLLAPLDNRSRDSTALPALRQHVPLKAISLSPLSTRTRRSWGSSCIDPSTTKAGSEESGSSSSHSSVDLEDEDAHGDQDVYLTVSHQRMLASTTQADGTDGTGKTALHFKVQSKKSHVPLIHRSGQSLKDNLINHAGDPHNSEIASVSQNEGSVGAMSITKECADSKSSKVHDSVTQDKGLLSNVMVFPSKVSQEEENVGTELLHRVTFDVNNDPNEWRNVKRTIRKYSCDEGHVDEAVGKVPFLTSPENLHGSDGEGALKSTRDEEERANVNCELRTSSHTKQPFNMLAHKDSKSTSNFKLSWLNTQVKDQTRTGSEQPGGRGSRVTQAKSRMEPRGAHSDDTGYAQSKITHLVTTQQHTQGREPRSAQQLRRPRAGDAPRSKSAVDLIAYKDMFRQIQGRAGPAIYEMFAGPVYEKLRVSHTGEKVNERSPPQCAPPKKTQQGHKAKHRQVTSALSKPKRSPAEATVGSAKSQAKPGPSREKPAVTPVRQGPKNPQLHTEVVLNKGESHLSAIEEAFPTYDCETITCGDTTPKSSSHAADFSRTHKNIQDTTGSSLTGSHNTPLPEPVLSQSPHQPKMDTWTSSRSSSYTIMSPVYQKFLDEAGDGPPTDDLLQCLAEELISLDERDASIGPLTANQEKSNQESSTEDDGVRGLHICSKGASGGSGTVLGSGLVVDDTITWRKGEVLGRGAYGTVYCGLTSQGQLIAAKQVILHSSDAANEEYSRLQGEVELLKTLRHINIVGFLGTSLHQHVLSIFMEYIPGGSIASVIHRFGPLPEPVLALYTQQILEGVAYLHVNRVIHRDLKGNNVMLMPTGVIKLIDFGCARRLSCTHHTTCNSVELLESVRGTPYWMAPEIISDTGYGRKSDIWSVGCTVFEMATGKPPLAHMDKMAALLYVGAQRGSMPSLPDGFSDSAKDFVRSCLTSDQKLRPSAAQLLRHSFIPGRASCGNSDRTVLSH